jgi:hypothetical protein
MADPLRFPDWLPPLVAERAAVFLSDAVEYGTVEDLALIKRITTDSRMEGVWKYLLRRRREEHQQTTEYENAIRDTEPDGRYPMSFSTRAIWMQHLAMKLLYDKVICMMTVGRIGSFRTSFESANVPSLCSWSNNPYLKRAEELRAEARSISAIDRRIENCPDELDALERQLVVAANAYFNFAAASLTDSERRIPPMVTAQVCRDLQSFFGRKLYSQAATIATIILNREVTAANAREWSRPKAWVKAHKT